MFRKLLDNFSINWYRATLEMSNADWDFYTNSTEKNLKKMSKFQDNYSKIFQDKDSYNDFKKIDKNNLNNHEKKQLKQLLKNFEEELFTGEDLKKLREKENEISQKFNSIVLKIDNKETTKAEITKILQTEPDTELRKKAYYANISSGDLIADDMKSFVQLRNAYACKKGYKNYFEYKLTEDYEVSLNDLTILLDEVYEKSKNIIKEILIKKQNELKDFFKVEKLEPYHYGFLTGDNPEKKVNEYFKSKEQIVEISLNTYKKMGWDVDKLIKEGKLTLDLFPRKNKNTHGFCFDIDAGLDARILANLTNNTISLDTMNHEMGHCVYTLGISRDLTFMDRQTYPAMTEAVAMMMGDIQKRENILSGIVPDDILEEFKNTFKEDEALFVSKSLTIINFEKEMYENPNQDLKQLWHDIKVKYQMREEGETPDNGWACIPHYLSHPAYYQNYFRASLIKAQMYKFLGNLSENPQTAQILNDKLFKYGVGFEESELITMLTGKKLSSDDFVESMM